MTFYTSVFLSLAELGKEILSFVGQWIFILFDEP